VRGHSLGPKSPEGLLKIELSSFSSCDHPRIVGAGGEADLVASFSLGCNHHRDRGTVTPQRVDCVDPSSAGKLPAATRQIDGAIAWRGRGRHQCAAIRSVLNPQRVF
jgi:hypothetical protein